MASAAPPPTTSATAAFARARSLAIILPAALLGGAYVGEYVFDLYPCEMCWWQRWPHFAAVGFGLMAYAAPFKRALVAVAALAIIVSGAIGGFHAGVEYGWWEGITGCASALETSPGQNVLDAVMAAPIVRCDTAPWSLFGISLAGWNFLISTLGGLAILAMVARSKEA